MRSTKFISRDNEYRLFTGLFLGKAILGLSKGNFSYIIRELEYHWR